jgi:hypothetical protein
VAALAAGLGRIGLRDHDQPTPRVLADLVLEVLLEPVVRLREHRAPSSS